MFIIRMKTQIQTKPNALYYYSREMVPKNDKKEIQNDISCEFLSVVCTVYVNSIKFDAWNFRFKTREMKNLCKYHINIARACLTNKCNSIQSPMIIRTSVSLFVHICPEHAKYFRRFFSCRCHKLILLDFTRMTNYYYCSAIRYQ